MLGLGRGELRDELRRSRSGCPTAGGRFVLSSPMASRDVAASVEMRPWQRVEGFDFGEVGVPSRCQEGRTRSGHLPLETLLTRATAEGGSEWTQRSPSAGT